MEFQLLLVSFSLHRCIALALGVVQQHRLLKQFEPLHLFNRALCSLDIFEDNEGLSFGFEVFLGNKVNDGAVFREDLGEGFFEVVDFYPLLKVLDVDSENPLAGIGVRQGMNVVYVEFGGCVTPL